jgi:hypothetical protein
MAVMLLFGGSRLFQFLRQRRGMLFYYYNRVSYTRFTLQIEIIAHRFHKLFQIVWKTPRQEKLAPFIQCGVDPFPCLVKCTKDSRILFRVWKVRLPHAGKPVNHILYSHYGR